MKEMKVFGEMAKDSELKGKKTPTVGIDLGTTNSCVAIIKSGKVSEVIPMKDGSRTLPSCVMWTGKGEEYIVGRDAYKNRYKPNVVYSVKRLMGTDEKVILKYGGKEKILTPEEVSAKILVELMDNIKEQYGDIKDVVITVPAYFNNKQIEATRKAGEIAGLNVLKTFREPTSASLCYDVESESSGEQLILVYDLGGGTFDVSLLRISNNEDCSDLDEIYGFPANTACDFSGGKTLAVVKTDGDSRLGGDDIDNALTERVLDKLVNTGIDRNFIPREFIEKLKLDLEQKKKSGGTIYDLNINFKLNDKTGTKVSQVIKLLPEDFFYATEQVYNKSKAKMQSVLTGLNLSSLASIVLVGGSTKSDYLKKMLRRDFVGVKLNDALNPDESVALGAAIEANRVKYSDSSNVQVFDVLPLPIGVLSDISKITKVIMKNQVVPHTAFRQFTNTKDDQEFVNIDIYQGDSILADECTFLGTLQIDNIPKGKAGTVAITVQLNVNAEGILKCGVRVGDRIEEKVLVNLFSGMENKEEKEDKVTVSSDLNSADSRKLTRWRRFAESLEDKESARMLNKLLDDFENHSDLRETRQKQIIEIISCNEPKVRKVKLLSFESDAREIF